MAVLLPTEETVALGRHRREAHRAFTEVGALPTVAQAGHGIDEDFAADWAGPFHGHRLGGGKAEMAPDVLARGQDALRIVLLHQVHPILPVLNRRRGIPHLDVALHRRTDPRRRLVEARIELVWLERGGEQVTVASGKAAPELRVVEHLAEQGAEAGGKGRVDGQLEVILPGAGAPRAEAGVQVVEDGRHFPSPARLRKYLKFLSPHGAVIQSTFWPWISKM